MLAWVLSSVESSARRLPRGFEANEEFTMRDLSLKPEA
jgi:hypothetical protein